jgi:hypothetical protein
MVRDKLLLWNAKKCSPPMDTDEIEIIVGSAWKNSQDGVRGQDYAVDPNVEFEEVKAGHIKPKKRRRTFTRPEDYKDTDMPFRWLIDGVVPKKATGFAWGPSGIGKSFIVLDMAAHVALGMPWRGRAVEQCLAIIVAAEGGEGVKRRLRAWLHHHKIDKPLEKVPITIIPHRFSLIQKGETEELLAIIREAEEFYGCKASFIILDTLNRTLGGNENDNEDMSKYSEKLDWLKEQQGGDACIMPIHHTGWKTGRARGSYALTCNVDFELPISKESKRSPASISTEKMRDAAKSTFEEHFVIIDEKYGSAGDVPVSAGVAVPADAAEFDVEETPGTKGLTDKQRGWLRDIEKFMKQNDVEYVTTPNMRPIWKDSPATIKKRFHALVDIGVLSRIKEGKYAPIHGAPKEA